MSVQWPLLSRECTVLRTVYMYRSNLAVTGLSRDMHRWFALPISIYFVGLYALTCLQEIQIRETRPFFNVQVTAGTGAATTTGTYPMSAAIVQIPMISSHCPRGSLWPL